MQLLAKPTHAVWACVALSACATYRPTPLEPQRVLEALESIEWDSTPNTPNATDSSQSSPVVGPLQLAAFAVSTHPELAALRAELGIQHALLVEAGLLPDPELGWDAMDGLASQLVTGSSSSVDAWAGFGLLFPLLGPGERQASIAVAQGRSDEARYRIAEAEWNLTCDIHVALEEVLAAETLLAQTRSLTELATTTNEYFQRAKDAGAATAIQANLAQGDLQTIRLDGLRADARVRQARQALNALLGLPPSVDLPLGPGVDPSNLLTTRGTPEQLTLHAVDSRPDLAVLLAAYQASEEGVRLAMSQRFPRIAVGTGIRITLPIFSKFGGPAIQTARARSEQIRLAFTARVHTIRQEIAAGYEAWQLASQEVDLVENGLLPNAEQSLQLSREALVAGEVTLLETLALQRSLVAARTRHTEARAERSKRAWKLLAASGWLLGASPMNTEPNPADSQ